MLCHLHAWQNTEYKHVINQVEQETGMKAGQEKDIICHLWNTREQTYHQHQQLELILQDLNLRDNNITEGLKVVLVCWGI